MNGTNNCGALLERLQHEHHELNCKLINIKGEFVAMLQSDMPQPSRAALARRLSDLAEELRVHFAEEEEGGCFEEAVSRCPSLAAEVNTLIHEHPQLLLAIEEVLDDLNNPQRVGENVLSEFDRFARKLRRHEARESRLLQMALGGDASDYDVEGNE